MPMPITVYLDTQDYSRLDDARAGRPAGDDRETLEALLTMKDRGVVRFVYSAMIISELLQYDGAGKDLTHRKAETLTLLTDHHTFIHPTNLMAFQVAESLAGQGLIDRSQFPPTPISDRDRWFPDIDDPFEGFGGLKEEMLAERIAGLSRNRKQRRTLTAKSRTWRVSDEPRSAFQEIQGKYPFSPGLISDVLPKVFDGLISKDEAKELWLDEVGDPARYVTWFFEVSKTDKSPHDWVRTGGETLLKGLLASREKLAVHADEPEALTTFKGIATGYGLRIARGLLRTAATELDDFGVAGSLCERLQVDDELLSRVPFPALFKLLLPAYLVENSGLLQSTRRPLRSDGGDIFHTLALPYCDLWRSDRYFSGLVQRNAPPGSAKIVRRLEDLPGDIARLVAH